MYARLCMYIYIYIYVSICCFMTARGGEPSSHEYILLYDQRKRLIMRCLHTRRNDQCSWWSLLYLYVHTYVCSQTHACLTTVLAAMTMRHARKSCLPVDSRSLDNFSFVFEKLWCRDLNIGIVVDQYRHVLDAQKPFFWYCLMVPPCWFCKPSQWTSLVLSVLQFSYYLIVFPHLSVAQRWRSMLQLEGPFSIDLTLTCGPWKLSNAKRTLSHAYHTDNLWYYWPHFNHAMITIPYRFLLVAYSSLVKKC